VGGINLDAHLDVRERIGSGMPFRRLIEGGFLAATRFAEVGLGRFANEPADLAWLAQQGATLIFAEKVLADGLRADEIFDIARGPGPIFVSIDMDGIDSAAVSGVSALNPMGLSVSHAATLAEAAGAEPSVRHFDMMELSPPYDTSGRTARVAALLFLSFLSGFETRPK
jgi:arginase family enzyme